MWFLLLGFGLVYVFLSESGPTKAPSRTTPQGGLPPPGDVGPVLPPGFFTPGLPTPGTVETSQGNSAAMLLEYAPYVGQSWFRNGIVQAHAAGSTTWGFLDAQDVLLNPVSFQLDPALPAVQLLKEAHDSGLSVWADGTPLSAIIAKPGMIQGKDCFLILGAADPWPLSVS